MPIKIVQLNTQITLTAARSYIVHFLALLPNTLYIGRPDTAMRCLHLRMSVSRVLCAFTSRRRVSLALELSTTTSSPHVSRRVVGATREKKTRLEQIYESHVAVTTHNKCFDCTADNLQNDAYLSHCIAAMHVEQQQIPL